MKYPAMSRYSASVLRSIGLVNPGAKVFFVGPTAAAWYGDFLNTFGPDEDGGNRVFSTLASVIADGNVVASRGDVVLLTPYYTESISTSTQLAISKAGLRFQGLGTGTARPTITLDTANTATITVSAADVQFDNIIFIANFLNVAALFTLTTAKGFTLTNCEVRDTDITHNFVAMVVTNTTSNAADGLTIKDNKFFLVIATGATKLVSALGTNDRWTITGNYYSTPTTNAGAVLPIATGKLLTNLLITNNRFNLINAAGTATGLIITTNGSTNSGYLADNEIQVATTTPLWITASSGIVQTNNLATHTADKSGYVMPVIDASS